MGTAFGELMSEMKATLLVIVLIGTVVTGIFFVAFGQITVRKLRKNSVTKNRLGLELMSGWDIFNVAYSLCIPAILFRRALSKTNSKIPNYFANSEIIYCNTTRFDRVLGRLFVISQTSTVVALLYAMAIDRFP